MDMSNYRPGNTAPPEAMRPNPPPSHSSQQGYYGYSQPIARDGRQTSGQYNSNYSVPSFGHSSGPQEPMPPFQPPPNYRNFSVPPPNFNQRPSFAPPRGFPTQGGSPFMPPDAPTGHSQNSYNSSQTYPSPSYKQGYNQGNRFSSSDDVTAQIVQETEAKLQALRENVSTEKMQAKDDAWLHNWLQKTGALYRLERKPSNTCTSIPDASSKLRRALHLIEKLQDEREVLKGSAGDTTENQHNIQLMMNELTEIRGSLSGSTLDELVKKLDRAGKKRRRCRRQQREAMKQKMEKEEKLEALHKAIDEKMAAAAQKLLDKKKEMQVKAAADATLSEVRRKVSEASKAVDLISAMTKLRSLRKDSAKQKGLYISPDFDKTYDSKAEEMEQMLKQQLSIYEREKKALEVMLEQEQEEDKEKEKEIKRIKEKQEIKRMQRATETWLFGPKVNCHQDDPIYKYRQYYEVANRSLNNFIQMRHEWDSYLVPMGSFEGSPVPHGWVQPVPPSSSEWESVLVKPESSSSSK